MINQTNLRRSASGSPNFPHNAGALLTGAVTIIDFNIRASRQSKYAPFNRLKIINNSSYDIIIYINQDTNNAYVIPAGTIESINKESIPALWSVKIENIGSGTIASGEVRLEVQKEIITPQDLLTGIVKKISFGSVI
jgi:hypothetical protein